MLSKIYALEISPPVDNMFVPMKIPELLPVPDQVQVDEFGFILPATQINKLRGSGYGYHCRNLCRYYIHKVNSRQISFKRTGYYYCGTCEIAMKCSRCRCCSRMGRAEPKARGKRLSRKDVKFIE